MGGALRALFAALAGTESQKLLGLPLTNPFPDMETDGPPEVAYLCRLSPSHLGWGPAGSLWVGNSPGMVPLPG